MKDDDDQSKGFEVSSTKQLNLTAIEGQSSRPGKPGSVKFPAGDDNLMALPRARKAPATDVADQIGLRLRIVYDDVLTQPVPDRFFELLRQLEGDTGSSSTGKDL
ncbi:NepR family anti-sigma factor [Methylocapsa palsarum]|uniref:Anti-sigma factor NepR domain-containing protein n=1 Tax=Methylocapsa palsarum TaxID=1612308 RepID=A0A1I3W8V7_9HYPH|nr:NepR family anti-sigma factor [Methylocapsa palsarum]SFK04084.1 hypothetical protein SAMN05444581_101442 [Methylocapsa palsarum]